MIKRILLFTIIVAAVATIGYNLHHYVLDSEIHFNLLNLYLFFSLATIIIYIAIATANYLSPVNAGYLYLTLTFVKLGLFVILFKNSIFDNTLNKADKLGIIIPFFVLLIVEVLAITRILKDDKLQ